MFTTKMIEPNSETMKRRFNRCVYEFSFCCYNSVVCIKKPSFFSRVHIFVFIFMFEF